MNAKIIFVLTAKGRDEVEHKTSLLFGDMKRALSMVDGNASFGDLSKRAAPSLRSVLSELMLELNTTGFIEDKAKVGLGAKIKVPTAAAGAAKQSAGSELDFTSIIRAPSAQDMAAEAAKIQAAKQAADAQKTQEAQRLQMQTQQAAADAQARAETEQRTKEHEARVQAVEQAKRAEAEQVARRAKEQEADAAKLKAEQEARERAEAEQRAKQAAEAARLQAEQQAKQQAEQIARAKQEAEAAKLKAEQELARVRQEAEQAKQQAEAEARARQEAELRAQQQAVVARQAAEQAAQHRLEQEALAKQQADAARLKAEQALAQARLEAEQARQKAEQAKQQAELEARARQAAEQQAEQNRAAAVALQQQEQAALRELNEQQAAKAREEEDKRAKQHALSAMSTQVRHTPFDTEPPAVKLAAIDLSGFNAKPAAQEQAAVKHAAESVARDKQAARDAELAEQKQREQAQAEKLQAQQAEAQQLADKKKADAKQAEAMEAKKLADSQAKAWAEAEQRAVTNARAQAEVVANPSPNTERRNAPRAVEKARAPRKPLPWGGMSVALLLVLGLAAWLVPQFMPMQAYAPKIEAQLSAQLQQAVHVGTVSARLLPSPRLSLNEVYIGEMKQVKAQKVQLNFGFSSLFGEVKRIDSVELQSAELNVSGVLEVANWFEKLASDTQYPITLISFDHAKLSAPAVQFEDLTGELKFSATGKFAAANVRANAGKYALQVAQGADNKLDTRLNVHGSALPLLPNWEFADLTAKGELSRSGFLVNDFDGRIAGGSVQGSAKLDWSAGWNMQGTLTGKTMTLASFSKLLEGDMDGTARFKLQASTLDKLADSAQLEGSFVAKKGVISGADIVETARLRSKENLPGGRTHFDEMSGNLNYANNAYHFKQIKIKSGVLNANGSADISNRQLTGRVGASLSIQEGVGAVELQLSGNVDTPNLRAGR
ncbi:MAG: AsmA-like C-terminal region-containing protein [Sideroxydans sp.]|nr:AsmA-like C-terminal region-containing protein [Sideroxydans sp.]